MLHFLRPVSLCALTSQNPGAELSRSRDAWLRRSFMIGLGAFITTLVPLGCGENIANPPYNPELAKTSAKYKELHPEEFPAPKTKGVKKRRGGQRVL